MDSKHQVQSRRVHRTLISLHRCRNKSSPVRRHLDNRPNDRKLALNCPMYLLEQLAELAVSVGNKTCDKVKKLLWSMSWNSLRVQWLVLHDENGDYNRYNQCYYNSGCDGSEPPVIDCVWWVPCSSDRITCSPLGNLVLVTELVQNTLLVIWQSEVGFEGNRRMTTVVF